MRGSMIGNLSISAAATGPNNTSSPNNNHLTSSSSNMMTTTSNNHQHHFGGSGSGSGGPTNTPKNFITNNNSSSSPNSHQHSNRVAQQRSLHVNVYNQNSVVGFGNSNTITSPTGGGAANNSTSPSSFHDTSPKAPSSSTTPKNSSSTSSYPNTMSLINSSPSSRIPSGNKNRKLDVGSPKVFRSAGSTTTTHSMIPSTPPKGSGPNSINSPNNTAAVFKESVSSPSFSRNNLTSIEPRRGIQTSNANTALVGGGGGGRFPIVGNRNVSATSNNSSSTTPSKKSIIDELKIDKVRNPLHKPISVHALPQMSNGQYESLFTQSRKLSYSSASAQGKRPTMEDEHFFIKNIEEALSQPTTTSQFKFHAMFGVFDGHCGSECAEHSKQTLFQHLAGNKHFLSDIERAFVEGFDACDMDFRQKLFGSTDDSSFSADEFYSGCTANVCVLRNDDLYVANLGDTRCVLAHKGIAVQLSEDHKPSNKEEKQRIERNGGIVSFGRVNGALAVSRALGDFEFKKKNNLLVSVVPDIAHFVLTKDSDFVLIACDGLWDVMTSGEAIKNMYQFLALYKDPRKACEKLVEKALKDGSMDNVTVILILLRELSKP